MKRDRGSMYALGLLAFGMCNDAAFAEEVTQSVPEACAYAGHYETYFSSTETPDRVSVRIEGNDCHDPTLFIDLEDRAGVRVFSVEMSALTPTYDCGAMVDCVRWAFEGAMGNFGEEVAANLPAPTDAGDVNGYYIDDHRAYAFAYHQKRPLFCYVAGKSFADCVVFMQGRAVQAFSTGS
ncbi:MAG: hypothetical protein AAF437_06285 [Pseudomonadota bacterium]